MGTKRVPAVDAEFAALSPRLTGTVVTVSLTDSTARSTQLPVGSYALCCATACFVLQGGDDVEAAATDYLIPAGTWVYFGVTGDSDDYLAGILASGSDTLHLMPV